MNEGFEGLRVFKVGGNIINAINAIKCVADVVLMAKTEEKLENMLDRLMVRGKEYEMESNAEKEYLMRI